MAMGNAIPQLIRFLVTDQPASGTSFELYEDLGPIGFEAKVCGG